MSATQRRIDALDVPTATLEARLRAGRRAEYAHLLHDADPDSVVPPLVVSLVKPRPMTDTPTGGAL